MLLILKFNQKKSKKLEIKLNLLFDTVHGTEWRLVYNICNEIILKGKKNDKSNWKIPFIREK